MKLNFNVALLNLEGEALKNPDQSEIRLNTWLANTILMSGGKENIAKLFDMALTLQREGILDLDTSDQKLLKTVIENAENLTLLSKGRLLEVFEMRESQLKKAK